MPRIKRKITRDYTIIQNDIFRDQLLGISDRGILCTMLSLPDSWNFSATGLASILPDGRKKVNSSLQRLESAGYLRRSRIYKSGKVVDWLYEFCDQPIFREDLLAQKETEEKNLLPQKSEADKDFFLKKSAKEGNLFPLLDEIESAEVQKELDNKIQNKSNIKELNTLDGNQSIYHIDTTEKKEAKIERLTISEELIKQIKRDIDAEAITGTLSADEVAFAVDLIAELRTTNKTEKICDRKLDPDYVRQVASKIKAEHILYAFECVREHEGPINNIRSYLRSAIFNAPFSMSCYYSSAVSQRKISDKDFEVAASFEDAVKQRLGNDYDPDILTR